MKIIPLKEVLDLATEYFNDKDKALSWWMTKDPNLGHRSPYDICKTGKGYKIVKLLQSCGLGSNV